VKILVSACLLGLPTRFDLLSKPCDKILNLLEKHVIIPVCPEQLGGLGTPRPPSEIQGGKGWNGEEKVINIKGEDVTENFVRGAELTVKIARLLKVDLVILKSGSPSCGVHEVYDGTFTKNLVRGSGVTAWFLKKEGFHVVDENDSLLDDLV